MENRLRSSDYRHSNSFYTAKSGLITTVAQGGEEEDVRRSRIQHLPSYRKVDLSGKLQFIVVFQTMEIERLSTEIQSLRVMLKDSERQIRNYLNYEVQIKELTENCHQLEEERVNYQNQVEQMSLACNSLYEQLSESKKHHERDLEELKRQFLKNREQLHNENGILQQKINQLKFQLQKKNDNEKDAQNKINSVSQELARLNQALSQNQNQIGQLKEKDMRKGEQLFKTQEELKAWQNAAKEQKYQGVEQKQQLEAQNKEKARVINDLQGEKQKIASECQKKKGEVDSLKNNWQRDAKLLDNCKRELDGAKKENENMKNQFLWLQNQHNTAKNNLNQSQRANQDLSRQLKGLTNDISNEKERSQQISNFANDLKNRIQEKAKEIEGFKKYLIDYDRQWQAKSKRQNELAQKVATLEPVLAQNNSLQEKVYQLNGKITEKDEELNGKEQFITELTIENKELFHKTKELENNSQRSQALLHQLEEKLEKQRQMNENQKKKLVNEYQRNIQKQVQEKKSLKKQIEQLQRDIEKITLEGLVKQEMKNQVRRLNENCRRQQKDIQTMTNRFQNLQGILKQLKEKCTQFNEVEKTNTQLKQQLDASFGLNDRMIKKIGEYEQDIEALTDENWRLSDKLREENFKDDFSTSSSSKTVPSLLLGNSTPLASSSMWFSNIQQVKPFESSFVRDKLDQASPSTIGSNNGYSTDRANFNTGVNVSRARDGFDSKRILEPSSSYISRQSNYPGSVYSSMIGQYTSRDPSFGLQRRERR